MISQLISDSFNRRVIFDHKHVFRSGMGCHFDELGFDGFADADGVEDDTFVFDFFDGGWGRGILKNDLL